MQRQIHSLIKSKNEIIQDLKAQGKRIFHVLSFGGGTQSAWLLDQHIRGFIDYDLIVFADTGAEPQFIHEQVAWWKQRMRDQGCTTPFQIVTHNRFQGGLEEMLFRYIFTDYDRFQMVAHCDGGGMLPRQCTVDFKIVPAQRAARRMVMGKNSTFPNDVAIVMDIGFAADEQRRAKRNQSLQYSYVWLTYPMIDAGISTEDSMEYLRNNNFPIRRSRCYFCPFMSDKKPGMSWHEIIKDEPFSFLKACWIDEKLREVVRNGHKKLKKLPYFHVERQPLRDVYRDYYLSLYSQYYAQLNTWIENMKAIIKVSNQ
ncbi:hypothetical protein [Caldibacillus debilis]|uniref:3'-phosphoadenosine 5'-phosphosulfate sulfotransferase (PAPS reductase)/FAD synthetase and related enzyme n=1 Tax=Caldibacillus debilis GB1 TaxID=1339248 RepID=A0A420VHV3_9BACI|nr:hypothetical protein [Caldibacillus debilis]RKO63231.1 hypothetical protein Cdeb_00323 [Caldibacillus debilis GB1]